MYGFLRLFIFTIFLSLSLSAQELEQVSLQLAWKHQFQFAGYYMAKEKGFYEDAGFDVDIREFSGLDTIEEVLSGRATYGIGRSSLIIDIARGKELQMLAAIFQSSPSVFIALSDSGIYSIKDFKNKKIMVTQDMSNAVSLQSMLKKHHLSSEDMHLQKHSYSVDSLLNGETDIMAAYISNEPFLLKEKNREIRVFRAQNEGFDFYDDILFTSSFNVQKSMKRVGDFRDASLKGWEYAFAHIDETVDVIAKKYNTQKKSKNALRFEGEELKKLAYEQGHQLGEIDSNKIQRAYDVYNVMGLIQNNIDIHSFIFKYAHSFLTLKEKKYLVNKKMIKVCIDPDWMPYEKIEKGKYIGISADYFQLIQQRLKTKIELIKTESWNESLEFAKARKCDILSLAMKTPSREKYLNFTEPYIQLSLVLATKMNVPFIDNFKILKEKKIGATKGFAFIELLQNKYPNLDIVEVKNSEEGLMKVVNGELFGYVGSLADISHLFQKEYMGDLKISGKFESSWAHSIAVRNDDMLLLEIMKKALQSINFQERKTIENRWISIEYDERRDYTLFWWAFGILALGLSISLILFSKQREINKIMQDQAARDYMTQLYNRRYFMTTSGYILDLARRNNTQISLMMLDIDNFKHINDTYGHQIGDETIIAIANLMKSKSRKSDVITRWGGEEFLILLPETDIEGAKIIAEKIRMGILEIEIEVDKGEYIHVSVSIGVAEVNIENEINFEMAINRADEALYEAKESGKNRVCVKREEF
ncbi:MAG: diguanylate cyclase [Campylobacterales bacterium]|nr:diguanylate cyclase [Campylobacterales bacterium]